MIAELFYPKELKEIIADLRAKDDLNEDALQRINNIPSIVFFVWGLVMLFFVVSLKSLTFFIIVFILSFLYAIYNAICWIKYSCESLVIYYCGERKKGIFLYFVSVGRMPYVSLKVLDEEAGKKLKTGPYYIDKVELFTPNKEICFLAMRGNPRKIRLDFGKTDYKNCLSISQLKEDRNDL